ncbi:MAG: hypothetical protein JWO06_3674 [Bacteroidota bacterium]|nr:hypothetical protein [Bacteroidota bacterium]
MKENHFRSLVKGASWRAVGTMDTIFLSFIFTGKIFTAVKIGGVELFTKIFLFYLHERVWMRLSFGTEQVVESGNLITRDKHYRSLIKGVSWRIVGSIDTFWIALFVNHASPTATQTAFSIAATEVITKVGLFWLHERVWMKVKWGAKPIEVTETKSVESNEVKSTARVTEDKF